MRWWQCAGTPLQLRAYSIEVAISLSRSADGLFMAADVLLGDTMGRPERPLDPAAGPLQAFASELRELRRDACSPKYLQMQRRTGRSRTALAEAAGGDHLPTWETVEAYVRACGGDVARWQSRWEIARQAVLSRRGPAMPPRTAPLVAPRRSRRSGAQLGLAGVAVAALLVVALTTTLGGYRLGGNTTPVPRQFVVVQNKVATGPAALTENATPAYLSSRPAPFCARRGCEVARSQLWSGSPLRAICKVHGAEMTNEDLASAGVARNPEGVVSSLWYRCTFANGVVGYLSEVDVAPAYRGGLGLPPC